MIQFALNGSMLIDSQGTIKRVKPNVRGHVRVICGPNEELVFENPENREQDLVNDETARELMLKLGMYLGP